MHFCKTMIQYKIGDNDMNITEFLNEYAKSITIKEVNDGYDLTLPFRLFNDESVITLHIKENQGGYFDIDDKGNTLRYLNNFDVNLQDYKDRVEIICQLFSLKIEDNLVKGVIGYGNNQLFKQLNNFLQGISHLSTVKYFC